MNTTKTALIGASVVAGLIWLSKKEQHLSGIGATKPKRRIWNELEQVQRAGVDLADKNAWQKHMPLLRKMANGKIKEDGATPMEQRYFNQLSRAYKSIAGTNLPYKESVVHNEYDDVILVYRDYDMEHIADKASDYLYDTAISTMTTNPEDSAFYATVAAIALGQKFVWKGDKIHRGIEQVVFGKSAPEERKKRISYLASPQKGGQYFDKFVHSLWERSGAQADDSSIANGVIEALQVVDSKGAASKICKQEYLKLLQIDEPALYQDVPF